jgi:hypothetical protein
MPKTYKLINTIVGLNPVVNYELVGGEIKKKKVAKVVKKNKKGIISGFMDALGFNTDKKTQSPKDEGNASEYASEHDEVLSTHDLCTDFPPLPSIVTNTEVDTVIAIGDIHGDLQLAIDLLIIPKLIQEVYLRKEGREISTTTLKPDGNYESTSDIDLPDATVSLIVNDKKRYYQWIGNKVIAVQVGDQIDRCRPGKAACRERDQTASDENSDWKILMFYYELNIKAIAKGCALYSLLGNHEIMNVEGNMNYVSHLGLKDYNDRIRVKEDEGKDKNDIYKNDDAYKGRVDVFKVDSKIMEFKNTKNASSFLACSRPSTLIVNGYLFAHAGVLKELIEYVYKKNKADKKDIEKIDSIAEINKAVQKWLLNDINDLDEAYITSLLSGSDDISPFWDRTYGVIKSGEDLSSKRCTKNVVPILEMLMLKGIVVGHTTQMEIGINSTCDDVVWRVDVGSSMAFEKVINTNKVAAAKKAAMKEATKSQVLKITMGRNGEKDTFTVLRYDNMDEH